jgi:hypothetical protein
VVGAAHARPNEALQPTWAAMTAAQGPRPSGRPRRHEIGRGGMGAVFKGRDTELGRELAVKVLLDEHRGRPDLVHRFLEEAQIAGQLQHPGVAPVYELGRFDDHRPFFTMKLIQGHTLAELRRRRIEVHQELGRFLGIFAQVCQTVAYTRGLEDDPDLGRDLDKGHRYDDACCAALAAAGKGSDAAGLTARERARLRRQALDWLSADLALWRTRASNKDVRVLDLVQKTLRHWQTEDLAGLREPEALAKVPEAEREGWRKLWAAVQSLRKEAAGRP